MIPAQGPIRAETDAEGFRTLVIDLADRPVNVLSPALRVALIEAVDAALADPGVHGLVLTARRPEFIAGADLAVLGAMRGRTVAEVRALSTPYRTMLRRMETAAKPVVAAINGTALGGGFELCLACHRRIAADVPASRIGLPEAQLGLLPGAGGTQRLGRLIGLSAALPLLLEGRRLSPRQALGAGIVDAVVAPEALEAAAKDWLRTAPYPRQPWDRPGFALPGGGPETPEASRLLAEAEAGADPNDPARRAILACLREGLGLPIEEGLEIEGQLFGQLARGDVAQNRIRAFFSVTAARKPARPAAPPFAPKTLGVLGAGTMGRGLAEAAALGGLDVVLLDRDEAAAGAGRDAVAAALETARARGTLSATEAAAALARIRPTADFARLEGCDALIEAVTEDRAVKAEVTRAALAAAGPAVLFASNTSKLPITGLAEASPAPERFIGMHFFSPVPRMALVEIVLGQRTGALAHAQALDLAKRLGKTPVVVRDGPGFFTSRVVSAYLNEGLAMLAAGVAPARIEAGARQAGMAAGPLAMADGIGLGTMLRIREQERADLGAAWVRGPDFEVIGRMVAEGRRGRRDGGGFYDDPGEGPKRLWPGLAGLFPPAAVQPEPATLGRRLLAVQAAEAARAWAAGVIDDPRMADVASALGWGFPGWTGGVMSLIDQGGVAAFVAEADRLTAAHGPRFAVPDRLRRLAAEGGSLYA